MVSFENIDIDIDIGIDKANLKNIDINIDIDKEILENPIIFACFQPILTFFPPDLLMKYQIFISIVDISANLKNIDNDKEIFENIDIDIDKESLEYIDINIDKTILKNIDIDTDK